MEKSTSISASAANQLVFDRFEQSMTGAGIMRLLRATHVISELRERKKLLLLQHDGYLPENRSTQAEDSTAWEQITVSTEKLDTDTGDSVSKEQTLKKYLVATYLRALELVTDFLENDKSIPVSSPEQNLNRALNRLILLEELETYLKEKYKSDIYA